MYEYFQLKIRHTSDLRRQKQPEQKCDFEAFELVTKGFDMSDETDLVESVFDGVSPVATGVMKAAAWFSEN